MTLALVSTPVVLRVAASPMSLSTSAGNHSTTQEAMVDIPVKLKKEFGFDEKVDLSIQPPSGVSGVSAAKVSIDKGKDSATLQVKVAKNATPGDHKFTVRVSGKYNNVNVTAELPVAIKIAKKQ